VGQGHHIHEVSDYTQRRTGVGRTPLDEWSARRTDQYLTTHNTHAHIISGERPQTHASDRAPLGPPFCLNEQDT